MTECAFAQNIIMHAFFVHLQACLDRACISVLHQSMIYKGLQVFHKNL